MAEDGVKQIEAADWLKEYQWQKGRSGKSSYTRSRTRKHKVCRLELGTCVAPESLEASGGSQEVDMKARFLIAVAAGVVLAPAVCFAQATTTTGAVGGAVTGAVVGGPVGAVVGGVVGGTVGAAAEPPREVYTYVEHDQMPSVAVQERVVVGEPLPPTVVVRRVPQHDEWGYAVVNSRRVIVDNRSRKVVKVID